MSAHVVASSDVSFSGRLGHTKHQRFNVFGGGRRVPQHRNFWMAKRRSLKVQAVVTKPPEKAMASLRVSGEEERIRKVAAAVNGGMCN